MVRRKEGIASGLLGIIKEGARSIARGVEQEMHIKRRLDNYVSYVIIMCAALFLILYGLGFFINSLFDNAVPGLSFIVLGMIAALVALLIKKA